MARCAATARSGERCRKQAIAGAHVCRFHGGAAPQVQAAARRRLAEQRAQRALDEVEVEEIVSPVLELHRIVSEAVALKSLLAEHVAMLEQLGDDDLHAVVAMYERAIDRAARFLEMWVRLDLDERLVRLQEHQGKMLVLVIERTLMRVGVDHRDEDVRRAVGQEIRALEAEISRDGIVAASVRTATIARESAPKGRR
jgi:hypothetical protein